MGGRVQSIPPERQLALLGQLLSEGGRSGPSPDRLKAIIDRDLPAALRAPVPDGFPGLWADEQKALREFRSFLLMGPILGKRVVAIGGGFSSGKSSFLNSFLGGESLLPIDTLPTTAVPAYLISGTEEKASGLNLFRERISLSLEDVGVLAHAVDGTGEAPLGRILRCLFISTPRQPFSHIALLDTPGYDNAGSSGQASFDDRDIALKQLSGSDAVLWFVSADKGTLPQDDIEFLSLLPPDIPKSVVISKADKPLDGNELSGVADAVQSALDQNGITCENIFVFSKRRSAPSDLEKIRSYIESMDLPKESPGFAVRFRKIFRSCRAFYESGITEQKKRLSSLNAPLTLADDGSGALQCLKENARETKQEIRSCEEALSRLDAVKQAFFTELKRIGDEAGVDLPGPERIELLPERVSGNRRSSVILGALRRGISSLGGRRRPLAGPQKGQSPGGADFAWLREQGEKKLYIGHQLSRSSSQADYLTLLLTIPLKQGKISADSWIVLYRIAGSAGFRGDVHDLLPGAEKADAQRIEDTLRRIAGVGLSEAFLLDSMMTYLCGTPSEDSVQYLADLYGIAGIGAGAAGSAPALADFVLGGNRSYLHAMGDVFFVRRNFAKADELYELSVTDSW
ncbi:MAG: dynamin family protein [Proteobacteria bacterium]|nr:dynamin family protein [Pseudomonadota bacterium]